MAEKTAAPQDPKPASAADIARVEAKMNAIAKHAETLGRAISESTFNASHRLVADFHRAEASLGVNRRTFGKARVKTAHAELGLDEDGKRIPRAKADAGGVKASTAAAAVDNG